MKSNGKFRIIILMLLAVLVIGAKAEVSIETIALSGWQAPESDPGVVYGGSGWSPGELFGQPRINNSGQVIFKGSLTGPGVSSGNDLGVFTGTSSSTLSMIARQGDPAPNTGPGVVYKSTSRFYGINIIDTGQFAFSSSLSSNNYGLWMGTSSADISLLAIGGDQAPDAGSGVTYTSFHTGMIRRNNAGQIAFGAKVAGPGIVSGKNEYGIWTGQSSKE